MNVPVPPPRMACGPTLLSDTMPMGGPVETLPTLPEALPWSLWIPKSPAKKGFHCGEAFTLTPQAPGGGVPPLEEVKDPMTWCLAFRKLAFQAVPMSDPFAFTRFWTIMAICWVDGDAVPVQYVEVLSCWAAANAAKSAAFWARRFWTNP